MKKFALILSFVFAFFFTNSTFANTNDSNSLEENKKELVVSLDEADSLEKLKAIKKADDTIIIIVTDDAIYIIIIR